MRDALVAREVAFRYRGSPAPVLAGVNLTIPSGARVVVTGPNGCGKTTLLRVLAGQLPPSTGEVTYGGAPVDRAKPSIAWIGAEFDLFEYLTPRENARFVAEFVGRRWDADRFASLADRYELAASSRRASELSRGNRRKLQLVTALLIEPALVFADEPFDGLDAVGQREWSADSARLADAGAIVMMSLHEGALGRFRPTIAIAFGGVAQPLLVTEMPAMTRPASAG